MSEAFGEGTRGWRARVDQGNQDFIRGGVSISLSRDSGDGEVMVMLWPQQGPTYYNLTSEQRSGSGAIESEYGRPDLLMDQDAARALYEALAEHFGHGGHDTRSLRRDLEHERKRVDKFIDHALRTSRGD